MCVKLRISLVHSVLLVTMLAHVAVAGGNWECLGGWEGDSQGQGYAFVGAGGGLPVSHTSAVITRLATSLLCYRFSQGDSTTRVSSPGLSLTSGISHAGRDVTVVVLAGPEIRWNDERTAPNGAGQIRFAHDRQWSGVIQGYFNASLAPRSWLTLLASYGGANRYVFSRLILSHRFKEKAPLFGLEGTAQGNGDVKSAQVGASLEIADVIGAMSLKLGAGFKSSWSSDRTRTPAAFVGVGFYSRL